jgi:hypothetical protein
MASLGVSSSMAVAWEPIARRVLQSKGIAVESRAVALARRASLGCFWLGMRCLVSVTQVFRGKPKQGGREERALVAVSTPN